MPLFGNTFSPKKTPPRKAASLSNLHLVSRRVPACLLGPLVRRAGRFVWWSPPAPPSSPAGLGSQGAEVRAGWLRSSSPQPLP